MPEDPVAVAAQNADLERERLTSLINSMGDGVIAIDEYGRVVVSNGAALNILDVNSTLAGKPLNEVMRLVDKNNQPLDLSQLVAEAKTAMTSRDWRLQYPNGETINLYTSIAPVRLGYGQSGMRGHVLLLRDITREKSLEEERDEFISVVSHELRTPIAIAEGNIGNAEFIFQKSGVSDPAITESLKQAHDQTKFLADMINDLSTLSRAERGKLTVEVTDIDVKQLVTTLSETYAKEAAAKRLALHTQLDPNLTVLRSGELYVREVLQNFITNAIKYTEQGQIVVSANARPDGVEFAVSDTGIGISKADQAKVFDKFFRSEDFRTRKNSGTGLGLYVTSKLARLLHADLRIQSELNQGSTFTIFIPHLRAVDAQAQQ